MALLETEDTVVMFRLPVGIRPFPRQPRPKRLPIRQPPTPQDHDNVGLDAAATVLSEPT